MMLLRLIQRDGTVAYADYDADDEADLPTTLIVAPPFHEVVGCLYRLDSRRLRAYRYVEDALLPPRRLEEKDAK
jgi:hypothetical protein